MVDQPLRTNRLVYAMVRVPESIPTEHAQSAFEARGWRATTIGQVHLEEGNFLSYIVAIPLYCAKRVALSVARSEIQDFSQGNVPLDIDELKLVTRAPGRRRRVVVGRTSGSWIGLLSERLRTSSEFNLEPVYWELGVSRERVTTSVPGEGNVPSSERGAIRKGLVEKREVEEEKARRLLKESKLPGDPFDAATMKVTTRAEPKEVEEEAWPPGEEISYFKRAAAVVVGFLAAVVFSAACWFLVLETDVWLGWVFPSAAVAVVLPVLGGLWMTGDRTPPIRLLGALGLTFAFLILGGLVWHAVGTLRQAAVTWWFMPVFVGVFLLIPGLVHLVVLHPRVRTWWSIPMLSLTAAAAAVVTQPYIAIWTSSWGLPSDALNIPSWFSLFVAAYLGFFLVMALVALAGLFGWASYFGLSSGPLVFKGFMYFVASLVVVLWVTTAIHVAMSHTNSVVQSWWERAQQHTTPALTGDFTYRACLQDEEEAWTGDDIPDEPVLILSTEDDSLWYVFPDEEIKYWTEAQAEELSGSFIPTAHRVVEGESTCPAFP